MIVLYNTKVKHIRGVNTERMLRHELRYDGYCWVYTRTLLDPGTKEEEQQDVFTLYPEDLEFLSEVLSTDTSNRIDEGDCFTGEEGQAFFLVKNEEQTLILTETNRQEKYSSALEVSRILGVTVNTVYAMCKRGELPHRYIKNGKNRTLLIKKTGVQEYIRLVGYPHE